VQENTVSSIHYIYWQTGVNILWETIAFKIWEWKNIC